MGIANLHLTFVSSSKPRAVPGEGEEGHWDHVPQRGHRGYPVAAQT